MSTVEPHVEVYNVDTIPTTEYGRAGKVALIGAFPTSTFKLDLFTSVTAAKTALRGEVDESALANYPAWTCLDYIFYNRNMRGVESVVIYNTNYDKGTLATSSDNTDIAAACTALAEEKFDILTVAEPINLTASVTVESETTTILNPIFSTLKTFVDNQFYVQKPFGIITGISLTNATLAFLAEFKELFKKQGIFKAVITPIKFNGEANPLTIEQSGCWHAAYTAGRAVNKSETAKVYPDLIGNNTKDTYPQSTAVGAITFDTLRENGFHTTTYKDRRQQTIKCISNITPVLYDMKIERVKNYMIRRLTLEDILGDDHNSITKDYVKGMFEFEKNLAIKAGYIVDMEYTITSIDSETVQAEVILYIPDVIRVIKLNVAVRISGYEEV